MPRHSLRSLWQPRSAVRPEAATEITGEQEERWQACDTHFHSRTAYFDFLPHGDSRDFTIYAFLHTFSIPILQPSSVSHCYRLSYVWQTPWAESPSKRQLGGNSASLSFLQMTHVTFWSARGMKVARKWLISARTVFLCVTAVTSRTADGTGLAGQGLAGRLGSCLWDGISGAWVSDVCLVHLFCPLCNPRNDMLLLIWAPTWTLWLLQLGWHLVISNENSHSAFFFLHAVCLKQHSRFKTSQAQLTAFSA